MEYLIVFLLIAADQLSKYFYVAQGAPTVVLIPGVLELRYVENPGAAWGMMGNHQLILYIVSAVITLGLCIYFVWKYKSMKRLMRISLALIIAGAVGNLIDRFALGYVRDMIYIRLIDFPIFNVADMAITIGGVLLFVYLIFFDREQKDDAVTESADEGEEADDAVTESADEGPEAEGDE